MTVPLSLAGTCAAMWVAGFSIDNLSLMALAVCVGFVVDDAIVMIENMFRNLENGAFAAARGAGGRAADRLHGGIDLVSLIAAFIPLLFMGGIVGRLFREFSRDAGVRDRDLDRGVAVGDADDLRLFRARSRRAATPPGSTAWSRALLARLVRFYGRTLTLVLASPRRSC